LSNKRLLIVEVGVTMDNPRDLEERLIDFAVRIINVVDALPNTKVGNHVAGQLLRVRHVSGTELRRSSECGI